MPLSLENAFDGLGSGLQLPDAWQLEAVRALRAGHDVIVSAPTGAGKTRIFELAVENGKSRSRGQQAVFTVPTRALANDKWREWRRAGWNVGIATGDLAENLDAPVLVATLETQRDRFLAGEGPSLLVIDEYQMIGDRHRGLHYELAIALAPAETRLLLLSGSVSNPRRVAQWLERLGRRVEVVETSHRTVPLDEIPLGALPRQAPRSVSNFWQKLALSVLLSNYGPLLVFAPHRRSAEKIAARIAEALPDDDPLPLGDLRLSRNLEKLLSRRVAFHHSGLSFSERAGIIEPLAKAGQLRVIVATMGLAAGVHFSVRSVFVSDTTYRDGPFERNVAPDELLQMFGRAGRRGLDETGYLVAASKSPRLHEAYPLELRRRNQVDWPTLVRRMHFAVREGESPLGAARELRDRLFSDQRIALGFGSDAAAEESGGEGPLFGLTPSRKEILNGNGEWEPERPSRDSMVPLAEVLSFVRGRYRQAEGDSRLVSSLIPPRTRLCRLDTEGKKRRRYGFELAVALADSSEGFRLSKSAAKLAGAGRDHRFTESEIAELIPGLFLETLAPAVPDRIVRRGRQLFLTGSVGQIPIPVSVDSSGRFLANPERRFQVIESDTRVTDESSGELREPPRGTAAHAWRSLGLVDENGCPTPRGVVFSLFQGGEGLAVAAALEDPDYPVEDIALHLANLRAGHRFDLDEVRGAETAIPTVGSERLAMACRQAYGAVDHEGYLRLGLPLHYGENAAEVVSAMLTGELGSFLARTSGIAFGPGDVERTFVDWLSLLRQLRHAEGPETKRWEDLRTEAGALLSRHERRSPLLSLPEIPTSVLQASPRHGIRMSGGR